MWKVTIHINGTWASSLIQAWLQKQKKALASRASGYPKKNVSKLLLLFRQLQKTYHHLAVQWFLEKTLLLVQSYIEFTGVALKIE